MWIATLFSYLNDIITYHNKTYEHAQSSGGGLIVNQSTYLITSDSNCYANTCIYYNLARDMIASFNVRAWRKRISLRTVDILSVPTCPVDGRKRAQFIRCCCCCSFDLTIAVHVVVVRIVSLTSLWSRSPSHIRLLHLENKIYFRREKQIMMIICLTFRIRRRMETDNILDRIMERHFLSFWRPRTERDRQTTDSTALEKA